MMTKNKKAATKTGKAPSMLAKAMEDVKARAKTGPKPAPAKTHSKTPATKPEPRPRDPRLPRAGAILTRTFNGKEIKVEVLDAGFRYDGKVWRSLSAIAKAVAGVSWNGYLFFNLQKRSKAAVAPKDGAK